jgi:hypothetical protein
MANPSPPFGFANNARRCLVEWNRMPRDNQQRNRARFVQVHDKVFERIRTGTPQATIHSQLLAAYQTAFNQLPPAPGP